MDPRWMDLLGGQFRNLRDAAHRRCPAHGRGSAARERDDDLRQFTLLVRLHEHLQERFALRRRSEPPPQPRGDRTDASVDTRAPRSYPFAMRPVRSSRAVFGGLFAVSMVA